MEKDNINKKSKVETLIKGVVGSVGGIIASATLGVGIYALLEFSLITVGGIVIFGVVPLEVFLTYCGVKDVSVKICEEELEEFEEVQECHLTLIRGSDKTLSQPKELKQDNGIAPMVHLELIDSNSYARKRVKNKR